MNAVRNIQWRIAGGRLLTPAPFLVAGIVNLTPDSFSGNGVTTAEAMRQIRAHIAEGADIVDIGAESTRPGAVDIGADEEWLRLAPVLSQSLERKLSAAPEPAPETGPVRPAFSVDTYRASTAAAALAPANGSSRGVDIINDISGGAFDPAMAEVVAEYKPGYVLGHCPARPAVMQNNPVYADIADELMRWFSDRMTALVKAGLPEECICLDPCIGFAKNLEHNLAVIAAIPRFAGLGRPLFFGISRKSIIGDITGQSVGERDCSTQVLTALLARAGVAVHRVHNVADTMNTLKIVRALEP